MGIVQKTIYMLFYYFQYNGHIVLLLFTRGDEGMTSSKWGVGFLFCHGWGGADQSGQGTSSVAGRGCGCDAIWVWRMQK